MRKYVGASLVLLGMILTAWGVNTAPSMNSLITRVFTAWPPDEATCLLVGGILTFMIGLGMASHRRKRD